MIHQIEGDVFATLRRMPSAWAHGIITDPPYGWDFMGREFDRQHRHAALDEQAALAGWLTERERRERGLRPMTDGERYTLWSLAWLREAFRVLVPGGIALVFQGSKSYDALAFAARLAGFEVLPMICGITGQAMAQGGNVGKLIDREAGAERRVTGKRVYGDGHIQRSGLSHGSYRSGCEPGQDPRNITAPATPLAHDFDGHGTRIRDQLMPIAVLMKPTEGSFAANARRWGVAGFDVDGARIETEPWDAEAMERCNSSRSGGIIGYEASSSYGRRPSSPVDVSRGRFPGNVVLDLAAAEEVGEISGESASSRHRKGSWHYFAGAGPVLADLGPRGHDDHGTASRYYRRFRYVARAPKSERMRGLETWHWVGDPQHPEGWRRVGVEEWQTIPKRRQMVGSNHPTLKPLELVRWAAKLILPPPGTEAPAIRERTTGSRSRVLVPFSGVGSEVIGCALAGWSDVVAIEQSPSYVEQGACRWRAWGPYSEARAVAIEEAGSITAAPHEGQGKLFEETP